MESPRDWPLDLLIEMRAESAELRATVAPMTSGLNEVRSDVRRLDGRVFQLLLAQMATLAAALGALVAALAS